MNEFEPKTDLARELWQIREEGQSERELENQQRPLITMNIPGPTEVVRIEADGRFFVHGQEVETGEEVRDGFIWFVNWLKENASAPVFPHPGEHELNTPDPTNPDGSCAHDYLCAYCNQPHPDNA